MGNTIITSDMVARDAAILLADNMVAAETVSRSHEQMLGTKVGKTVRVKVPVVLTARNLTADVSTTASDITESSVDLTISAQPYNRIDLTSEQKTFSLDDFTALVTRPAILAIRDWIDVALIKIMAAGFARYTAGTDGNSPTTVAHLLAGRKLMKDNGCPNGEWFGMLDTTAEIALLQLAQFTSADYGTDAPNGLKEAILGRRFGIDWLVDQNIGTHARGDYLGTVLVKDDANALAVGDTAIVVDGLTEATGTMKAGTRFTLAGDTTVYCLTADATAVGSVATLNIFPALVADPGNDALLTFKAAFKQDMIYHRNAVALAVVPPAPLAGNSSVAYYNGFGIRVTMDGSISSMSDSIVYDTFFAGAVIQPKAGCIING